MITVDNKRHTIPNFCGLAALFRKSEFRLCIAFFSVIVKNQPFKCNRYIFGFRIEFNARLLLFFSDFSCQNCLSKLSLPVSSLAGFRKLSVSCNRIIKLVRNHNHPNIYQENRRFLLFFTF